MAEQQQFLLESQLVSETLEALYQPDKINLGALGNMVPQLHIHHIARFKTDIAWPGPVWGNTKGEHRESNAQQAMLAELRDAFSQSDLFSA